MVVRITVTLTPSNARRVIGLAPRDVGTALKRTTERLVDLVEETTLITKYTQTSQPAKPAGSTYIRTFRLQASSEKSVGRSRPTSAEGTWKAKAPYASRVIGLANQQDPIHQGRWPALELSINRVERNAGQIFDDEIRRFIP